MKNKRLTMLYFLVGISLCIYPMISGLFHQQKQKKIIATYQNNVRKTENLKNVFKQAQDYNRMLWQREDEVVRENLEQILSEDNYKNQLSIGKDGMMGVIEIPKINVNLPIWHGTSEKVISNGVGHFRESSLPAGGENTRCILTSHRGLPSAGLFTRLDELKEGDVFFLNVCGEMLAYRIYNIQVLEPKEAEKLPVLAGRDIVSLITCTPYGINTHRLVVDGERISYQKKSHDSIRIKRLSPREVIFFTLPIGFSGIMVGMHIRNRKVQKKI